jgi:hypothetical protein
VQWRGPSTFIFGPSFEDNLGLAPTVIKWAGSRIGNIWQKKDTPVSGGCECASDYWLRRVSHSISVSTIFSDSVNLLQ